MHRHLTCQRRRLPEPHRRRGGGPRCPSPRGRQLADDARGHRPDVGGAGRPLVEALRSRHSAPVDGFPLSATSALPSVRTSGSRGGRWRRGYAVGSRIVRAVVALGLVIPTYVVLSGPPAVAATITASNDAGVVSAALADPLGAGALTASSFPVIPSIVAECVNGIDDDEDGLIDLTPPDGETADPDCASATDNREEGDVPAACANSLRRRRRRVRRLHAAGRRDRGPGLRQRQRQQRGPTASPTPSRPAATVWTTTSTGSPTSSRPPEGPPIPDAPVRRTWTRVRRGARSWSRSRRPSCRRPWRVSRPAGRPSRS